MAEVKKGTWACKMFKIPPRWKKKHTTENHHTQILFHWFTWESELVSRHPHPSHESPSPLAESQCCSSSYYDNIAASVLHSLTSKGIHSKPNNLEAEGGEVKARWCLKQHSSSYIKFKTCWKHNKETVNPSAANAKQRSFSIAFIYFGWTSVCFSLKGYTAVHIHPDTATALCYGLNCCQNQNPGHPGKKRGGTAPPLLK